MTLSASLPGFLHRLSNESEVRGFWSVIIFIWTTVGGCAKAEGAHLSHPCVTVHCLAAAVMSTRLLLSVADGTSKNKCYLSLSMCDDRERNTNVEPDLAQALSSTGILEE